MAENGNSKPRETPITTPEELKHQGESAPRQKPAEEGNAVASSQAPKPDSGRIPFSNRSQVDADFALARRLQEQERAYMMLRMNGGVFGSVGGSYVHVEDEDDDEDVDDDEDFDDPELEHNDVEDSIGNGGIDSVPRAGNGNRTEGHLHVSDGEGEDEDSEEDDVDAFDACIDHEDDDDDDDDDEDEEEEEEEDDNLGVEFDPEVFSTDEAYARALQDAEEREMAARLFAIAGIHDLGGVTDPEELGGTPQDMWEEVDPDELSYEELLALGEVVGTESRGLSADRIASLPSINYKSGSSQNGTNDFCVICRLDFEDGETLTLLSCKHSYHSECINNWLKINKVCPVCSTEVSTSGHS